jgi:hypothetical protein
LQHTAPVVQISAFLGMELATHNHMQPAAVWPAARTPTLRRAHRVPPCLATRPQTNAQTSYGDFNGTYVSKSVSVGSEYTYTTPTMGTTLNDNAVYNLLWDQVKGFEATLQRQGRLLPADRARGQPERWRRLLHRLLRMVRSLRSQPASQPAAAVGVAPACLCVAACIRLPCEVPAA